ncbi:uncharacterized protein EI97DRAFT_173704 [Westerdykella ornata]|uniref:Autophagy protein n=1 Tax=Westerdykella ornata TaxID=318751 RepID=A0A6A6JRX6_WESOR|nr:uncharacterized protein EI97DRAFT_173704 [Westerdykella ornata]KAF2279360.1 hypothetical protein EI97DRAFT_173704 [Westerdykella ornata]
MGWLWGSSESSETKDKLDPSLRDFLESEAPTGPKPALPSRPKPKSEEVAKTSPKEKSVDSERPVVPPESQFQDGRYAHLWKSYTPQQTLLDQSKGEQEKLKDIVDAYNDRRAEIGRVAMENCALEYMEQFQCMKNPSFKQAITVCREETRKFNRCYDLQAKFLKALGFLSMEKRSAEEDEKIQMHADKLYQQLMEQEALIAKAKEEGQPIPQFESVLSKRNIAQAMGGKPLGSPQQGLTNSQDMDEDNEVWSQIKPERRAEYEQKLAELPEEDREFERKALLAELRAQTGMAKKVEAAFVEERINRLKRREAGQSTVGDVIKRLWGWD